MNNNFHDSTCPYCDGFMYEIENEQGHIEVVCSQCGYVYLILELLCVQMAHKLLTKI